MATPDVNDWIAEVKAGPEASGVGMMLAHQGIVRGTTRSGEPVSGMMLGADQVRLEEVLAEARTWPGVVAVRAWVNEGSLAVGDDIMKVLVAGDIRENVFGALQRLVSLIKNEVVSETEMRAHDDHESARRDASAGDPSPKDTPGPALVAIVGKSDSGKTTLIEKLLPELLKLGLRVGTVKHDAHSFEIDHPGKDSWRHGQAGALAYVVSSPERLAYISRIDRETTLTDIARRFFAGFDLVVAEGYKRSSPHLVELFRAGAGHPAPLCAPGEALALVTDAPLEHEHRFALDDAAGLARFLADRLDALRAYD